jgi:hypothetical protein
MVAKLPAMDNRVCDDWPESKASLLIQLVVLDVISIAQVNADALIVNTSDSGVPTSMVRINKLIDRSIIVDGKVC